MPDVAALLEGRRGKQQTRDLAARLAGKENECVRDLAYWHPALDSFLDSHTQREGCTPSSARSEENTLRLRTKTNIAELFGVAMVFEGRVDHRI